MEGERADFPRCVEVCSGVFLLICSHLMVMRWLLDGARSVRVPLTRVPPGFATMGNVGSARGMFTPELTRDRFCHLALGHSRDDSTLGVAYEIFINTFHLDPAFPAHPHKTPQEPEVSTGWGSPCGIPEKRAEWRETRLVSGASPAAPLQGA